MTQGVDKERLQRELDVLRRDARHLSSQEIAGHACKANLEISDALRLISEYSRIRSKAPSGSLPDAIADFVSSLCIQSRCERVLEYTAGDTLLTVRFLHSHPEAHLTYVARNADFAAALRLLLAGKTAFISADIASVVGSAKCDAIICAPPIGYRPPGEDGDGFGSDVVRALAPLLATNGILCWVTGRGVLFNRASAKTFASLAEVGLHVSAIIDLAPGALAGTAIEGALVAFQRKDDLPKFVGILRDTESAELLASALVAGPSKKSGPGWMWLDAKDERTFADIEHGELIKKLTPKGRHKKESLRSLLAHDRIERADKPLPENDQTTAFLFVPEYAGSRVTADLQEQTVKPTAVYRLAIDTARANPRFLAQLLNSPFGRELRDAAASGSTIQRVQVPGLLSLELPIPAIATQERIARINSDIALLQAEFRDMQTALEHDWTALADAADKIDALKGVLNIERQIADWWRELPYPIATIYRRYQVSIEPKERLETLLHFFEMCAVYLAAVGASHVKAMRQDWQEVMAGWLHPTGSAGIERADFGFWIGLAGASLKDVSRITSDKDLRAVATDVAGAELVESASSIGALGKSTTILDVARRYRNSWKGHGGHMKASDAARLDNELQQQIRDFYEATASTLRRLQLVRPGMAEVLDSGMRYKIEKLSGSDPTFVTEIVELVRPTKSNTLAFWMDGARTMCRAMPFFRLGAPQQPQETSFYVFNRVEKDGFRWISFQEAREQEFVAPDDELLSIIALRRGPV
ncbi:hypothetical protein [Bradyrhizobium sp. Ash2021]|uniref:hypothetical protein n=1 Tax=Bradyrhizobium sp. Ash2021 TaxID=2954771 RepID=UPI002814DCA4|nr:hypothetical protein [Bradyrhizobium sp. Ash2021]WMT75905.1 hypothetical protein NL528_05725 [Bradyrhizobium sp. Ash2021]